MNEDRPFAPLPIRPTAEPTPVTRRQAILTAANLLSGGHPNDVHPEYVRALTEVTMDLLGLPEGDKDSVTAMLWALAE